MILAEQVSLAAPTSEILQVLIALLNDEQSIVRQAVAEALNNFSIDSLLTIYFQQSCKLYQSSLQGWLLNYIGQRWLVNRQVVKLVNQEIYWLEQGQWQHLPIPDHHPHFQSYLGKVIKEWVGAPLLLTFSKLSPAENVTLFSSRSSSSPQAAFLTEHKEPQPK